MKTAPILFATALMLLMVPSARAQTQTPARVYTSTSATTDTTGAGPSFLNGLTQNSATGALSVVTGSPFSERLDGSAIAVDALGRFLFVVNPKNNDISMFRIDSSTGALTEVTGSPFAVATAPPPAASTLSAPTTLATEPTGQYLYVGYQQGSYGTLSSPTSALVGYIIDPTLPALLPGVQGEIDNSGELINAMLSDVYGRNLYVVNGTDTHPGIMIYPINASSGALITPPTSEALNPYGRSMAIDPQARFLYYGTGQLHGIIEGMQLSPVDGLITNTIPSVSLPISSLPYSMAIDSTGAYLYVAPSNNGITIYAIDQVSGALTQLGSPAVTVAAFSQLVADPQGPYLYTLAGTQVHAYQITVATGSFTEVTGSPFGTAGGVGRGIAIAPAKQSTSPISGPLPQFDTNPVHFADTNTGAMSATAVERLINNGQQDLLINVAISISGSDPNDFAQTNNCGRVLIAGAVCTISLTFQPTVAGGRQAFLTVVDNGPGGSQMVSLSGNGLVPMSGVTLVPGSLAFTTILAGTKSAAQSVTVTNSGAAALNITNAALSGPNPSDFTIVNGCTAAVPVNGSCAISVTFAPLAAGQRTAQILLTDNAPGTSQSIALTGSGTNPYTISTANSGSASAMVTAGTTAQYSLQIAPAIGFTGTVYLQCSGAPAGTVCSVPAAVTVTSGSPVALTVSISTTAGGFSAPASQVRPFSLFEVRFPILILAGLLVILMMLLSRDRNTEGVAGNRGGSRFANATLTFVLALSVGFAGCGGSQGNSSTAAGSSTGTSSGTSSGSGSSTSSPPTNTQSGTPKGIYTVTINASSDSGVQEPFPLTLTVQ